MPAKKQRQLLAALTLSRGRACSFDELIDAIWSEAPPVSARKLLQIYVSQLRKLLAGRAALVTTPAGYALHLEDGALDADRFERLAADAGKALDQGNPALAFSLGGRALGLWQGPAYAEVMYEDFARSEVERLEELRLTVLEGRLDASLQLGRHDEALGEALALTGTHPLRERAQGLAMLALYRAGRQTEALDRYSGIRHRLDEELGLEPSAELRRLQRRILQQDPELHVALQPVDAASALPAPPNPLVGRERELKAMADLFARRDVRLLVLTGAGGSGKTRLALEAAREAAPSYANGAVWIELAPLRDPELVLPTIAQRLDLADAPEQRPLDRLADALRTQEVLLLLDNAEHVRPAMPVLVELLSRAPRVTLLVTSRSVLHLSGEHVVPVAPLADGDALELFAQRARALRPAFRITDENRTVVREICDRLDGLPLAIELAAARIRTLTPQAVLERLTQRLSFLAGGPHDLPARQQTLRETLDWSYDLLPEDERALLARLSVFAGGMTLAAAAAVCLDGDDMRALELLERLVDASLVRVDEHDGETRYGMLETVRQYAADRLSELGAEETRRAHAEWCQALVEKAELELSGEHQTRWFSTLEAEHDNARAALDHFTATREEERGLRLAVALSRFWYVRGHLIEARRRLERALADANDENPMLLRRARTAVSAIALLQGDYVASTSFSEGALEAARRAGEPRFVANALSNLGAIVLAAGDHTRAADALEEAVSLAREVGDDRIAALAINNLGDLALTTRDYQRAGPLFEESHALLRARGDTSNVARSLFNLGAVNLMLGRPEAAIPRFREGLLLAAETGDMEDVAWCLEGLASLAAEAGDGERAATLLGAAGALLERMGATFKPFERQLHDATAERAQSLCGVAAYGAASVKGAALPLDQAVELAHGRSSAVATTGVPEQLPS